MGQEINAQRFLKFTAQAAIDRNIKGDMMPVRMNSVDWFNQRAINATNDYTSTIVDDGTHALCAGGEHGVKLTTGTTDDDMDFLATGLIFDITQAPSIESKVEIEDVSGTVVFFGFSDAVSETSPAGTIDADGGTVTAVATDAVGFLIDADLGTSSLYCVSVLTGGAAQEVDTGIDWLNGQAKRLRVKLDASGNAYFYADGVQVGYIALAVADVPLCAMFNDGTRDNDGANIVEARYLAKWQDIP
jgi:hypothetical protein